MSAILFILMGLLSTYCLIVAIRAKGRKWQIESDRLKVKKIELKVRSCRLCGWKFESQRKQDLCFRPECMAVSAYCYACGNLFIPAVEGDNACTNCYEYNKRVCGICDALFVPDSPTARTCHGCRSDEIHTCDVPECKHSATDHNEEFDWHFCHEHADWFKSRINTIAAEFPKAVKYLEDHANWRFQAELEEYPPGCYDDLHFFDNREDTAKAKEILENMAEPRVVYNEKLKSWMRIME